jgi:hypothetical protein
MVLTTAKLIASLLQMHGPDATVQSDHQGIDALLGNVRGRVAQDGSDLHETGALGATEVYFRKSAFVKGGGVYRPRGGAFVRGFRRI